MSSKIRDLEIGILNKLKSECPEIKTFKQYQGDFDRESLTEIRSLTPFALILYAGGVFRRRNQALTGTKRMTLFLGCKNLRGEIPSKMGAYELLDLVTPILDHVTISGYTLNLTDERMIYHDKNLSIFGQEYSFELEGRSAARAAGTFIKVK